MKKYYILGGLAVLVVVPIFLFLFFFVFDKDVSEPFSAILEAHKGDSRAGNPETVKSGNFYGTDEFFAGGAVRLIKFGEYFYLRFEDGFKVFRSPDSHIYLGSDDYYSEESRVAELKGNAGAQNYLIPAAISSLEYSRVWIWSKSLEKVLGSAVLEGQDEQKPANHDTKRSKLEENAG